MSKKSSHKVVNVVKGFFELPNLLMLRKQKGISLLKNLALVTFYKTNRVPKEVILLYFFYLMALSTILLHLIKQNFLFD